MQRFTRVVSDGSYSELDGQVGLGQSQPDQLTDKRYVSCEMIGCGCLDYLCLMVDLQRIWTLCLN